MILCSLFSKTSEMLLKDFKPNKHGFFFVLVIWVSFLDSETLDVGNVTCVKTQFSPLVSSGFDACGS